jgi:hypothetical protein
VLARLVLATLLASLLALAALSLAPARHGAEGSEAAAEAARWVGSNAIQTQSPRRDGDGWEIDVVRADGSLVEVTIGDRLELLGLDEELGPGGGPAHDEVTGATRARAVRAARALVARGRAVGVERERDGDVEVAIGHRSGARVEVELDGRLRPIEVESEQRGDE